MALDRRDVRQRRDVAGAVRHRRDEPAPRFRPGGLGHVLPDRLGLGDLHRHDRPVRHVHLPVRPVPAGHRGLRDEGTGARDERLRTRPPRARRWRVTRHEHSRTRTRRRRGRRLRPDGRVRDTPRRCSPPPARSSEAGYKKVDAYSPFPVHGVDEAHRCQDHPALADLRRRPDRRPGRIRRCRRSPRRSTTRSTSPASRW